STSPTPRRQPAALPVARQRFPPRRASARRNRRWSRRTSSPADLSMKFLTVGHAGADDLEYRLFHFIDRQAGGIDVNRIRRLRERRVEAGAVAATAPAPSFHPPRRRPPPFP